MRRASINYWVDMTTAIAFVVCAVSGILFLLPDAWWMASGMLGVSASTWHTLHDWSGVLMTAGVAGHLVLHWRWVWRMTQREFADEPVRDRRSAPSAAPAVTVAAGTGEERRRLYDRRDFLGAALAAGAVAFVGAGLLTRGASGSGAVSTQTADASQNSGGEDGGSGSDDGSGSVEDATGQNGWGESQDSGSSSGASRVVVDTSRCVGCGHCLGACAAGVFAWSSDGRTVTAASPDACSLCGRCQQVCSPQAITLNA